MLRSWRNCFIAGSVAIKREGTIDCVENAKVTLKKGSTKVGDTFTDIYGDFKFDGLTEDSGDYVVEISSSDQKSLTVNVVLGQSQSLPNIQLS